MHTPQTNANERNNKFELHAYMTACVCVCISSELYKFYWLQYMHKLLWKSNSFRRKAKMLKFTLTMPASTRYGYIYSHKHINTTHTHTFCSLLEWKRIREEVATWAKCWFFLYFFWLPLILTLAYFCCWLFFSITNDEKFTYALQFNNKKFLETITLASPIA